MFYLGNDMFKLTVLFFFGDADENYFFCKSNYYYSNWYSWEEANFCELKISKLCEII